MYHEDIFYPFLPMFSTFDGKMVNVVENAECFKKTCLILPVSHLRCFASRTLRVSLEMDGLKQRDSSSSDPLSPTELLSRRKYFCEIFYIYVL